MDGGSPLAAETPGLLAAIIAVHPVAVGGIVLSGPASAARQRWLELLAALSGTPPRKIPVNVSPDRLLDLAATLAAGAPVAARGLLAEADRGVVVLPMAERHASATVSALCTALDRQVVVTERDGIGCEREARLAVVACDESEGDDAPLDPRLAERLHLRWTLRAEDSDGYLAPFAAADCRAARARLPCVTVASEAYASLCQVFHETSEAFARKIAESVNNAASASSRRARSSVRSPLPARWRHCTSGATSQPRRFVWPRY